jgi:ribosomal protein S18 acetylase RimI-like enzyme
MEIRQFHSQDQETVIDLWGRCGLLRPWNDPVKDIARKAAVQPELFWVAEENGEVVGTIMAGYDGHRGWIYSVGVDPSRQRAGIGRALLRHAEEALLSLGCAKINLQVRENNPDAAAFYESCGFNREPVLSYGKRLTSDLPPGEPPASA